ncbi:MAG: metallophosphoesterase [Clostridia bacterium]|nr:metallophosphoesterase [Clostridia bacterium]
MLHYITSPGQVQSGTYTLSELGKKQSRLLGEHLKTLEFHGKILTASAPYAMETAEIIAGITESEIIPFKHLDADTTVSEDGESLMERIVRGYRTVPIDYPKTDLLFVASPNDCEALINIFTTSREFNTRQYDCALTTIRPAEYFTPILFDTSFIPYEDTTFGSKTREACDIEYMRSEFKTEVTVPDLSQLKGERILHIGDTQSASYPYYRRLFELVRPDIILHTGDMADEVKIGRHPEFLHEYTVKITELFEMMKATGARIIIILGNHDVAEAIAKVAPYAEVYEHGSEVVLSGVPCRLGHQVIKMVFDRKYCMYGHGMSCEVWRDTLNIPGEHCRFNVMFGNYVYDLANDRYVRIQRPTLIL